MVKYEVSGNSAGGYYVSYTNEAGVDQWVQVKSGWSLQVMLVKDLCYQLAIIPVSSCSSSGTVKIYFNGVLKKTDSQNNLSNGTVVNSQGATSCGTSVEVCD
jgi:hypothetical protein